MPHIDAGFGFEPVPSGTTLAALETPFPIVDVDVVERNLVRWQERCGKLGLSNRPHVKTHKTAYWARRQVALGAIGVTCQTLREAEVMADAGIQDILVSYNIVGAHKLARLVMLARRVALSVVADSPSVVSGLSDAASTSGVVIDVLVECNTGAGRCGVPSPAAALSLAQVIASAPGLRFAGLMTYPPAGRRLAAAAFLAEAKGLCEGQGLPVRMVSSGGTPDLNSDEGLDGLTEYRAGTYIYNDRSLVARGACTEADCALTVLTTVVSRQSPTRAIIDAGSKALTTDLLGFADYGMVRGSPTLRVARLDEEHGYVDQTEGPLALQVGDCIRIVPNHACVVSNLFDHVALVRGQTVIGLLRVDARARIDWAGEGLIGSAAA